jgi:hypothetical protein
MKRGQLAWIDSPFFSTQLTAPLRHHCTWWVPQVERWNDSCGTHAGASEPALRHQGLVTVLRGSRKPWDLQLKSQPFSSMLHQIKGKRMTGATNIAMKRWAQHGQLNVGIVPTSGTSNSTDLGGSWPHFLSLRETHLDTENTDLSMKRSKETSPFPTMSATDSSWIVIYCHETRPILAHLRPPAFHDLHEETWKLLRSTEIWPEICAAVALDSCWVRKVDSQRVGPFQALQTSDFRWSCSQTSWWI